MYIYLFIHSFIVNENENSNKLLISLFFDNLIIVLKIC
jgi:hypothetical protein